MHVKQMFFLVIDYILEEIIRCNRIKEEIE